MSKRLALEQLFGKPRVLLGVVHLLPLPGSPRYRGSMDEIVERAATDALALERHGLDGAVVENFGDAPFFPGRVPADTVAALTRVVAELGRDRKLRLGVNVLRNDAGAALGVAAATGAGFVRINVHVGASLTDQGIVQGRAHETLRRRRSLWPGGAGAPLLFCDVDVKHAAPLAPREIGEWAEDTYRRGGADVLLVTGRATGKEPDWKDVERVRRAVPEAAVLVASGITEATVGRALQEAHGAIVGTALLREGRAGEAVDPERVRRLVEAAHRGAVA
jgi:hypothetical protein